MSEFGSAGARRAELAAALTAVRARLDSAARAAGRAPGDVALLPVTKYFPASDAVLLYELGCRSFGESREQEAGPKITRFRESVTDPGVAWHMIGRLQRNKARAVARWAHTIHSVDSIRLADAVAVGARAAHESGDRSSPIRIVLQVSLVHELALELHRRRELLVLCGRRGRARAGRSHGCSTPRLGTRQGLRGARSPARGHSAYPSGRDRAVCGHVQ